MGWQDRDWAKWTDEERASFVGGGSNGIAIVPGAVLGIVVSLVAAVVLTHPFRSTRSAPQPLYGSGIVAQLMGHRTMCTKMHLVSSTWTCDVWSMLLPNQQALRARPLPNGGLCATAVVDQPSRSWICETPS